MWLVKNKNGEVVHELPPTKFKTAIHKAAYIKGGTLEASTGCVLPISSEELNEEIQKRRDDHSVSNKRWNAKYVLKSNKDKKRWPHRVTPDMEKVTKYLQSRGMWPKEA